MRSAVIILCVALVIVVASFAFWKWRAVPLPEVTDDGLVAFAAAEALPALLRGAVGGCGTSPNGAPLDAVITLETRAGGLVVHAVLTRDVDGGLPLELRDCISAALKEKAFDGEPDGGRIVAGRTYEVDVALELPPTNVGY